MEHVTIGKLRRIAAELDAQFSASLRWRGGDLDRLMDEAHAALVGRVVELLRADGWDLRLEVSYSVYGERGSIDVLAWHPTSRTLLVVEVKTELVAVEETLRKHDEKVRLARQIAAGLPGWEGVEPATVSRLLVLPSLATPRRRVARHDAVLGTAYPLRGHALRRWIGAPGAGTTVQTGAGRASAAGLLFLETDDNGGRRQSAARKRIRRSRPNPNGAPSQDADD